MDRNNCDKKLNEDFRIIIDEILKLSQQSIQAIIMYGSYGRGEGAFYLSEKGRISCYNDFDLLVVTDNLIDISQIKISLENKLDVKWIDLSQKTKNELSKLKLTIFNYDLKYGSSVIYGEKNILKYIPEYNFAKIGLKECETLYFTRLWCFMGSLPVDGFKRKLDREETRFFRNQMAKSILAVVDVLLIQEGYYDSSYRKRVNIVKEKFPNDSVLIKWSRWAIKEKLIPKDDLLKPDEVKKMYSEIAVLFKNEMFKVLSKYYSRTINGSLDIEKALTTSKSEWILLIKTLIKTRKLRYFKKTKIKLAQSYLLDSYLIGENVNGENINKCKNLLISLKIVNRKDNLDWNELRILVSKLRMEI